MLLAGCTSHPGCVPVAGTVVIDGKPLTTGWVRIVPEKHRIAQGEIDASGHFRLTSFADGDGCVSGTHRVEVISNGPIGTTGLRWLAPKKYAKAATSGLTVTIDKPRDDLVLELTWSGGKPFVEKLKP
jgi:hypothetical protein